jgi:hypothetical protein
MLSRVVAALAVEHVLVVEQLPDFVSLSMTNERNLSS